MTINTDGYDIVFSCNKDTELKAFELAGLAQFRSLRPYVWKQESAGEPDWLNSFENACKNATLISLHESLSDATQIAEASKSQLRELVRATPDRVYVAYRSGEPNPGATFKAIFGDSAVYRNFNQMWTWVLERKTRGRVRGFGYAIISSEPGRGVELFETAHGAKRHSKVNLVTNLHSLAKRRKVLYPFNATEAFMSCVVGNCQFEERFPNDSFLNCLSEFVLIYDVDGVLRMSDQCRERAWNLSHSIKKAGFDGQLFEACLVRPSVYKELLDGASIPKMLEERFGMSYETPFTADRLSSCGTWSELSCRLNQFLGKPTGAIVGEAVKLPV